MSQCIYLPKEQMLITDILEFLLNLSCSFKPFFFHKTSTFPFVMIVVNNEQAQFIPSPFKCQTKIAADNTSCILLSSFEENKA